jgi:hypothetical protein
VDPKTIQKVWTTFAVILVIFASNAWLESQGSHVALSSVLDIRAADRCWEADKTVSCDWARIMALYGLLFVVPVALVTLLLELTYLSRARSGLVSAYPRAFNVRLRRGDWLAAAYQLSWQVMAVWWPVYVVWHCVSKIMNTTVYYVPNPHAEYLGGCQAYIRANGVVADSVNSHLFGCIQVADFYRTPFRFGWIDGPSFYPGVESWAAILISAIVTGLALLTLWPLFRHSAKNAPAATRYA